MNRYICIHGHFYQPPRENPWLDEVELQESAYPYHNWNERITTECYARNSASRLLDSDKKIRVIVNNYSKISFNFGPTLLYWLKRKMPDVYEAILEADRVSQLYFNGHGSAIAQVYNHMIMPLANSRDKRTQVIWGIRDFESRFKRKPEGMWLAETAVDLESLDILAEMGIKFTVLAPRQAKRFRKISGGDWKELNTEAIDPRFPYLLKLPSGRTLNIFFYDGPLSQAVAFEGLLNSGEDFSSRMVQSLDPALPTPQLAHIATDGESYGHHHKFGDMALAYCIYNIESRNLAHLTIYADFLEKFPPVSEVEIHENSSWSCAHGVERWRNNCGCSSGTHPDWNQDWRSPLRKALDWLRDRLIPLYEKEMKAFVADPWAVRNDYIDVILDRNHDNVNQFILKHVSRDLNEEEKIRFLRLLEMQTNAQLMYTSCGWFFDEVTGIETVQIMKYAARAIQLAKYVDGDDIEFEFIKLLGEAPSNMPEIKNAARAYKIYVQPSIVNLLRVGAHFALTSLFEVYPEEVKLYCYNIKCDFYDRMEAGRLKMAVGRGWIKSDLTWNTKQIRFAVLHFGDHNFVAGVDYFQSIEEFQLMCQQLNEAFSDSNIPEVISLIHQHFRAQNYSLWHLFKTEQQKILNQVLKSTTDEIEASFRQIHEHHYPLMQIKNDMRLALPKALITVVEFILYRDLCVELEKEDTDRERVEDIVKEMKKWGFVRDKASISYVASQQVNTLMQRFFKSPDDLSLMERIEFILKNVTQLNLDLDLWKSQNLYFTIGKRVYAQKLNAAQSDAQARVWVTTFESLGSMLQIRIAF